MTGEPWQLQEVTTVEHEDFVHALAARYNLPLIRDGSTIYFADVKLAKT
jgi:hypothetical protein